MNYDDPVYVEYKGKTWELKQDIQLTAALKQILDNTPSVIAKRSCSESGNAAWNLAAVVRDCLEYNYGSNEKRGDSVDWRYQALWTLKKYARGEYNGLDPEAKNPCYEPWNEDKEEI